ncbi:MAG: hypothetical protein ACJ8FY_14735 [Gemmataceae bacterium]
MTRRLLLQIVSLCCLAYAGIGTAHAQVASPYNRNVPSYNHPVYSPYLNLLRGGGNVLQNYQGLVRPELSFYNGINTLNQQVNYNERIMTNIGSQVLPDTGHTVGFNNLSHYYSGLRGSAGGGGGVQRGSSGGGGGSRGASPGGSAGGGGGARH